MFRLYPIFKQRVSWFSLVVLALLLPVISSGQQCTGEIYAYSTVPGYTSPKVVYPPNYQVSLSIPRTETGAGPAQGHVSGTYYAKASFSGAVSVTSNGVENFQYLYVTSEEYVGILFLPSYSGETPPSSAVLRFSDALTGTETYEGLQQSFFDVEVGNQTYPSLFFGDSIYEGHTSAKSARSVNFSFTPFWLVTTWSVYANMPGGGGTGYTQTAKGSGKLTIECLTPDCYLTHVDPCTNLYIGDNPYPGPCQLQAFTFNPTPSTAGLPLTGYVHLTEPAPTGGRIVNLVSKTPTVASVPASVTVPAGQWYASFPITTPSLTSQPSVTVPLRATMSGSPALTQDLTLYAALPSALNITPASATGGVDTPTGTVTLNSPAPTGGLTILLSSDTPSAATVPTSVTVAAGATSASFPITTYAVASGTTVTVTISAQYGPTTVTGQLSVSD